MASKKKHECDNCHKVFGRNGHLVRHVSSQTCHKASIYRNRSDCGKYVCDNCDKTFASAGALKNHTDTFHNSEGNKKNFVCDMCNRCFNRKGNLHRHQKSYCSGSSPVYSVKPKRKAVKLQQSSSESSPSAASSPLRTPDIQEALKEMELHDAISPISTPLTPPPPPKSSIYPPLPKESRPLTPPPPPLPKDSPQPPPLPPHPTTIKTRSSRIHPPSTSAADSPYINNIPPPPKFRHLTRKPARIYTVDKRLMRHNEKATEERLEDVAHRLSYDKTPPKCFDNNIEKQFVTWYFFTYEPELA